MPQLQELTTESAEQMIDHISHLHNAPVPEIACIANTLSALILAHDFDYLLNLAYIASLMSAKCLGHLDDSIAPESEA